MNANDIFNEILKDPILIEKYNFSKGTLEKFKLHDPKSKQEILEIIKLAIYGVENETPVNSVNSQIKSLFNL